MMSKKSIAITSLFVAVALQGAGCGGNGGSNSLRTSCSDYTDASTCTSQAAIQAGDVCQWIPPEQPGCFDNFDSVEAGNLLKDRQVCEGLGGDYTGFSCAPTCDQKPPIPQITWNDVMTGNVPDDVYVDPNQPFNGHGKWMLITYLQLEQSPGTSFSGDSWRVQNENSGVRCTAYIRKDSEGVVSFSFKTPAIFSTQSMDYTNCVAKPIVEFLPDRAKLNSQFQFNQLKVAALNGASGTENCTGTGTNLTGCAVTSVTNNDDQLRCVEPPVICEQIGQIPVPQTPASEANDQQADGQQIIPPAPSKLQETCELNVQYCNFDNQFVADCEPKQASCNDFDAANQFNCPDYCTQTPLANAECDLDNVSYLECAQNPQAQGVDPTCGIFLQAPDPDNPTLPIKLDPFLNTGVDASALCEYLAEGIPGSCINQ